MAIDEVIVETGANTWRVAALEAGRLVDALIAPRRGDRAEGAVHLGRVARVIGGLGAFIDIADGAPGFLDPGRAPLRPGESVRVQIVEPARAEKPPRLTTAITLAAPGVVLRPGRGDVLVSRRIVHAATRRRLSEAVRQALPEAMGAIIRWNAEALDGEALAKVIAALVAEWRAIDARGQAAAAPSCLHEAGPARALVVAFAAAPIGAIVVDDRASGRAIERDLTLLGLAVPPIEIAAEEAVFDRHDIASQWAAGEAAEVALPEGARLTIEATRALTAVDVDAGASAARREALAINLDAAEELARQLRIRDIGGVVSVDFLRLGTGGRERLIAALARACADDRRQVRIAGWTPAGLLELVRGRGLGASMAE